MSRQSACSLNGKTLLFVSDPHPLRVPSNGNRGIASLTIGPERKLPRYNNELETRYIETIRPRDYAQGLRARGMEGIIKTAPELFQVFSFCKSESRD